MRSQSFTPPATFADVSQPPLPLDTFTTADLMAARAKLLEANVPPFTCRICGAEYFFLTCEGERPTHWRCSCGRIEKTRWWESGPPMRLAPMFMGFVVLGELPAHLLAELPPVLIPVAL